MAKSAGRPTWFKMFGHQHALIESVPDATAGRALKAVFRYFCTDEMDELDPLAFAVFSAIKPYIDEAFSDFESSSKKNRQNVMKRWSKEGIPRNTTRTIGMHSLPSDTKNTEAEAEAEAETETEAYSMADKPPKRARFVPPTVEEVRAYCQENGYQINPEYFVDYYTANGWMVGQKKMKDWKATVRNWNRRETDGQSQSQRVIPKIPGIPSL